VQLSSPKNRSSRLAFMHRKSDAYEGL
jgi:hypothetical protein